MLHIDTRKLHPGINNVGVPQSSRHGREGEGKRQEETRRKMKKKRQKKTKKRRKKKRERRGKVERRATRGAAASGAGRGSDVYPGRPLFPRCPPAPRPPPRCPSSWSPMCPLHLRFLRRRSAPSAIRCCGALHLRYACSCCSDALAVASPLPSPVLSGLWRTEMRQAQRANESSDCTDFANTGVSCTGTRKINNWRIGECTDRNCR